MQRKISNDDKMFLNYIKSINGEYGDEYLQNGCRTDLYWQIASIRRYSFSFYPLMKDTELLLVGDKYGAVTGIACEKARFVDAIVPSEFHREAICNRYQNRGNLNVVTAIFDNWDIGKKYAYALVNMENTYEYDIYNSYEFERLINPTVKHLMKDGKLLVLAQGNYLWTIQRLLFQMGFTYQQHCDPLGNGALFLEASKEDTLLDYEVTENSKYLLNDKWIQKHGIPYKGGEVFDQDLVLIEKVKKIQIDLLKKLLEVCKINNLQLLPIYGTLLGMIRDGGMIPGDDDIDVALMRVDFDKLIALGDEFQGKYFLQTNSNDDCFFGGFIKLRNTETTAIHPQNEWTDACEGISIDIFPIDNSYVDFSKEERKKGRIRLLQRLLYAKSYGYFREFKDMSLFRWKTYKYIGKLFNRNRIVDKLNEEMQKGDKNFSKKAIYCHYGDGKNMSVKYMNENTWKKTFPLLFEDVLMNTPSGWEELLCGYYGEGYMNRMDFWEGKKRHGFYDVDVSYTIYKRRFGGLKHPRSIQEPVVLFGDGTVFESCLRYYKDKVNVAHLVQLPNAEAMDEVMEIPVETWKEFESLEINKNTYRAIICSGDARLAERILQDEGYKDYYIFWYNREWMLYANQTQIWKEIQEF